MKKYSRRQGGWIASFVIIGAILLLALLVGVYFLKNQSKTSETQTNKPSNVTKDDTKKPSSNDSSSSSTNKDNVDDALPSTDGSDQSSRSDSSSSSSDNSSTSSSGSDQSSQTGSSGATTDALPHTGPETSVVQLAVIALLAFAAASYVRSRRLV